MEYLRSSHRAPFEVYRTPAQGCTIRLVLGNKRELGYRDGASFSKVLPAYVWHLKQKTRLAYVCSHQSRENPSPLWIQPLLGSLKVKIVKV
ncbi:hypothetical protein Plhal304r1_c054g0138791 [Plasmopara halstedii]